MYNKNQLTPILPNVGVSSKEDNDLNRFVSYYIEARKRDPEVNRRLLFTATALAIAEIGTIEDLRALSNYYKKEWEEIINDRITNAI